MGVLLLCSPLVLYQFLYFSPLVFFFIFSIFCVFFTSPYSYLLALICGIVCLDTFLVYCHSIISGVGPYRMLLDTRTLHTRDLF
jgi:hypothetical protein